ncbi:MAG: tetratricopeptide repeat protein [Nitrospirae bacterium]|nr:tetratricopeptide repeat protein [Nitrospirota bacterium]
MIANELFQKGLALLRDGNALGALVYFEKAYSLAKTPELESYMGFCIASERGKITEAIMLCNDAIAHEPANPVHYLNLGRVYLKADRRSEAIDTFRKGLSLGDNEEIHLVLEKLGIRRKPFLFFLPRGNFLNRYLGLVLHRLRLR